jgi:uncharacterized protein (TIRG00374 family)
MKSKLLKITGSVLIGGLFLWLAFRNVEFSDLWDKISGVTFYWLPFFVIVLTLSHYLRAERWRLLLGDHGHKINRSTLFAGVMLGYVVNVFVPRLGEISRPVYVARKEGISSGNLIGTVVAERFFDLLTMFFLILVIALLLVSDFEILQTVFGVENWSWKQYIWIPIVFIVVGIGMILFYKFIILLDKKSVIENPVLVKIVEAAKANNLPNFSAFLERMLDELFIDRMENNEEIFSRVMTDKEFRSAAHEHLAEEIFKRVREVEGRKNG